MCLSKKFHHNQEQPNESLKAHRRQTNDKTGMDGRRPLNSWVSHCQSGSIYWVGQTVVNPDPGFQPLAGPGPTIFFTVLFLVAATLVYLAINAYTKQPVRIFTIVAAIVFLVGLIPDFLLFGEGVAASMGMGVATPGVVGAANHHAHCGLCNHAVGLHPVGPQPLTWGLSNSSTSAARRAGACSHVLASACPFF